MKYWRDYKPILPELTTCLCNECNWECLKGRKSPWAGIDSYGVGGWTYLSK